MKKAKLVLALGTLIVLNLSWAAPLSGAAHSFVQRRQVATPATTSLAPIRFRDDRNEGLLVSGWVNDEGPFTFALDTGAGVSIVSSRLATSVHLTTTRSRKTLVGGLSTSPISSNEQATATKISLGHNTNVVPGKPILAIVPMLPGGLDGILDPTDLFGGMAYSIDLPNHQLLVFDGRTNGLDVTHIPKDGAVVRWVREAGSDRPFVRLGDGQLALLDTGSGFGLAVNQPSSEGGQHHMRGDVTDLGGGGVQSRQIAPTTVNIGALVLRGVPTDVLIGVPPGTPLIIGRRALYPFKITFDPSARLIAFEPTQR